MGKMNSLNSQSSKLETSQLLCKSNKEWMAQLPEKLQDIPLYNMALPGSHDAMSYCLDISSPIDRSESQLLQSLDKCVPCITRPLIYKWSTTQELSIKEQLNAGIRYLDLRISHKPNDTSDKLYFVHGIFTEVTVQDILKEIAVWLQHHKKEVIILACRCLEELNPEQHLNLVNLLITTFGNMICPKQEYPTLNTLWRHGYQVIISYENDIEKQYKQLWPAAPYWWGNTVDPQELLNYLEKQKQKGRPEQFFVAGINLTEDLSFIMCHLCESLKEITLSNQHYFIPWVKNQTPGDGKKCINIVAADFIDSGSFVNDVIALNEKLLQ
ncbi:PI-PLC X domain-containing protein 1 [Protopterus annectens]|uniref:PI-PLC X domain-containing protein 1 n=1 Tax=Protopterus annectens TaxID=7888 RepID=UPI001CFAC329|nr:PI-PLC X domain-containing protein 1 [Protopterus annectens]